MSLVLAAFRIRSSLALKFNDRRSKSGSVGNSFINAACSCVDILWTDVCVICRQMNRSHDELANPNALEHQKVFVGAYRMRMESGDRTFLKLD